MYERMLDKNCMPTAEELAAYCDTCADLFCELNDWLTATFETIQKVVFPYGNSYGWGISHKKKSKLICNVFAESNSFTVMLRLSEKECGSLYENLSPYGKSLIDNKYPCNGGGWIHYRVTGAEQLDEIQKILKTKCGITDSDA